MQKALFALAFADGDDTEEEIEKYAKVGEGMLDTLLRGSGFTGNFVYAGKNLAKAFAKDDDPLLAALTASPPLHSKLSKIRGADYSRKYITEKNCDWFLIKRPFQKEDIYSDILRQPLKTNSATSAFFYI